MVKFQYILSTVCVESMKWTGNDGLTLNCEIRTILSGSMVTIQHLYFPDRDINQLDLIHSTPTVRSCNWSNDYQSMTLIEHLKTELGSLQQDKSSSRFDQFQLTSRSCHSSNNSNILLKTFSDDQSSRSDPFYVL